MFEFPGFFFFFFLLGMSVDHSNTKDYISKIMTKLWIECSCEGKFLCQLDQIMGCPDTWLDIISKCVYEDVSR